MKEYSLTVAAAAAALAFKRLNATVKKLNDTYELR
jgi:hypothetical protein